MIKITESIKLKCPTLRLGIIRCSVQVLDNNDELWEVINTKIAALEKMETSEIGKITTIAATRKGYRALGKDPARYRPSAESLLRRVVKGKGLYKINNVVDVLNLVSISTGFSIGGYDSDQIEGEIVLDIGKLNEPYEGIGRGSLNIEGLATFRDDRGAFGTPTSDSIRTSVTSGTTKFLMVIVDFGGTETLTVGLALAVDLLKRFGKASNIEQSIVN